MTRDQNGKIINDAAYFREVRRLEEEMADIKNRLAAAEGAIERLIAGDKILGVVKAKITVIMMILEGGAAVGPTMLQQVARIEELIKERVVPPTS